MITVVFVLLDPRLHIHVKSVSVHQALLSSSAREQVVVPSISPFPARCWNGSINETTLKTKVQTLTDASSPRQLFSVGGLSANQRAGPQEVAICGASRRRSPRLMCFLERRKCDGGGGGGERLETRRTKATEPRGWGGEHVSQNTCWVQECLLWLPLPACSSSRCSKTERKEGGDVNYAFSTLLLIDNQTSPHDCPLFIHLRASAHRGCFCINSVLKNSV